MPLIRFLLVILSLSAVAAESGAQDAQMGSAPGAIQGFVTGPDSVPLAGVRVSMEQLGRVVHSDAAGWYSLDAVPRGSYLVTFSRMGVAPALRRVQVVSQVRLDLVLNPSLVELAPIAAVATSRSASVFASPQPVAVLEGAALRASQNASVGDAVEGLPGVRSLSMSPGIGKPVIRGLTSNRVVVVDDGQRLETQQWGSDHAPNTETIGATRIEVLRGPASVLYGSDALGGVVNIVRAPPPDAAGGGALVRGRLGTAWYSNPRGPEMTGSVEAAAGILGTRLSITRRETADLFTPGLRLDNTGNAATTVNATAIVRGHGASLSAGYVTRAERIEIYEDPLTVPGFTGYQRIFERRAVVRGDVVRGEDRVELAATYERNERREFDDVAAGDVVLGLLARTGIAQLSWHHRPMGRLSGTVGASLLRSDFEKFGLETLIPSNVSRNAALYVFEQGELGRLLLSAGARYDLRTLSTVGDQALRLTADRRQWRALTGNFGALYRMSEPLALVLNVGRGFRAPSAADLFSNGYHEGTRAFERGDPTLGVETSFNVDVALRAQSSILNAEIGGFVNRIRDYIYLQPQGSLDTLLHTSGDAVLKGVEAYADLALSPWLSLRATGDYTRGDNTTLGVPLTQIPPARATVRLQVQPPARGSMNRPYASLTWEGHAAQQRLHPGDVGTAGYGLVNAASGVTYAWSGRVFTLDVVARNLLDRPYRSFMSAYRTIAEAPGRSVAVRAEVGF